MASMLRVIFFKLADLLEALAFSRRVVGRIYAAEFVAVLLGRPQMLHETHIRLDLGREGIIRCMSSRN